jgi:hypothetical protein
MFSGFSFPGMPGFGTQAGSASPAGDSNTPAEEKKT